MANPVPVANETPAYTTRFGVCYQGDSRRLLSKVRSNSLDVIITSPPFGLQDQKEYGNPEANDYIDWLYPFLVEWKRVLKPDGSLIIEIDGAWASKQPVRTIYQYKLPLLAAGDDRFDVTPLDDRERASSEHPYYIPEADPITPDRTFDLVREFQWYNPGANPESSQQYVKNEKIRVRPMANPVYWFTPATEPKGNSELPRVEIDVAINHEAWGLANRDPDTLPGATQPSDLSIPGNWFGIETPDVVVSCFDDAGKYAPPTLPSLARLRSDKMAYPSFEDGLAIDDAIKKITEEYKMDVVGTAHGLSSSHLETLVDMFATLENAPTAAAFGIDPVKLADELREYIRPAIVAKLMATDRLLIAYRYLRQAWTAEPNVLSISHTASNTHYLRACRKVGEDWHPARFPRKLIEYFVPRLTTPGDIVCDPFAGSNVVGKIAEDYNRKWLAIELREDYVRTSEYRFLPLDAIGADNTHRTLNEFG